MTGSVEPLVAPDGTVLGRVERLEPGERPRVDVFPAADADGDVVADTVLARFGGHRVGVVGAPAAVEALVARRSIAGRRRFVMDRDLSTHPAADATTDVVLEPFDPARTREYGELSTAAYPPGHPDHGLADVTPDEATATLDRLVRGELVGPWAPAASFHAVGEHGAVVGVILVSELAPSAGHGGGPWISDIFVDPSHAGRGIGRALIERAVGALVGHERPTLGLAVTAGNPAQRLYASLGFVVSQDVTVVDVPDHAGGVVSSST